MNPPYDKNLHLKILREAMKHGGEIICLHPYTWLSQTNVARPMGKWRSILNGHCKSLEIISHDEMNNYFGTGNSIETGLISCWGEDKVDLENYGLTPMLKSLYTKTQITNTKDVISLAACRNGEYGMQHFKDKPVIRKEYDVPIYTWHSGATLKDALLIKDDTKKVGMVLYFKDENERQNFIDSLDTKFMTWYWKTFVVENGDNKLINYFFRMKDYSHPWNDADLYEYFGLNEEEIKEIENAIR
jgi:hypothetical protein